MKKILLLSTFLIIFILQIPSTSPAKTAYLFPIDGTIERGLIPPVKRIVKEAEEGKADVLIVEIETFGGELQAMIEIRDILLETDLHTIAFINKRAISAGALIALSCKDIVMVPGGTIGAATPVYQSTGGLKEANEKIISYARSEFKSTAEQNGHPIQIAEAMVDKDVEISDPENPETYIIEKGKLLTLTTEQAADIGLADHQLENLEELKIVYDLRDAKIVSLKPNWSEQLARFLTNPSISGILLMIGIIGLFMEFRTPTMGIAGLFGGFSLLLFFFGYYIYGLAEFMDIALFVIGIILLALEAFVIPGFGITGILGIFAVFTSFVMAFIKYKPESPFFMANLTGASAIVTISLITSIVAIIILVRLIPRTRSFSKMVLTANLNTTENSKSIPAIKSTITKDILNKTGISATALRPSGTAVIDNNRLDVITEGDFIESGKKVKIVRVQGNKIIVREV